MTKPALKAVRQSSPVSDILYGTVIRMTGLSPMLAGSDALPVPVLLTSLRDRSMTALARAVIAAEVDDAIKGPHPQLAVPGTHAGGIQWNCSTFC